MGIANAINLLCLGLAEGLLVLLAAIGAWHWHGSPAAAAVLFIGMGLGIAFHIIKARREIKEEEGL